MRIKKISGYKNCVCCGKKYGYFHPKSVYCTPECETRYRGKKKQTEVSLGYVPKHLIISN